MLLLLASDAAVTEIAPVDKSDATVPALAVVLDDSDNVDMVEWKIQLIKLMHHYLFVRQYSGYYNT